MRKKIFIAVFALLMCSLVPASHGSSAFNVETDEGYFKQSFNHVPMTLLESGDLCLLSFFEDDNLRRLIVYLGGYGEYNVEIFDVFNGQKVFKTETINETITSLKTPKWINLEYFAEGTVISDMWLDYGVGRHSWYWAAYPERSYMNYHDLRDYYETVFPREERFPRVQSMPVDHPLSRIPRSRDHIPLTESTVIAEVMVKFELGGKMRLFAEVRSQDVKINGKAGRVDEYYELFTGAWLHTLTAVYKGSEINYWDTSNSYTINEEYLQELFRGRAVIKGTDLSGVPTYFESATRLLYFGNAWGKYTGDMELGDITRYLANARTIGDLRRVYERTPHQEWFVPVQHEAARVPPFTPPDKTHRPVWDVSTLREALKAAKNGDTIVVLSDIHLDQYGFDVKNKKLKLTGLEGCSPRIVWDMAYVSDNARRYLFNLHNSKLEIENLRMETTFNSNGFQLTGKSTLTLGRNTELCNFCDITKCKEKSTLIIDGAYLHHNSGELFVDGFANTRFKLDSTLRIISGEIAYNRSMHFGLVRSGHFIMEGGSIHHNATDKASLINIFVKGEISGGEIHDNVAYSTIQCVDAAFTMTGGDIYANRGISTGGIQIYGDYIRQGVQGRFVMKSGSIHDNTLYLNDSWYGNGRAAALNLWVSHWATADISGGSVYQSQAQQDMPSIKVEGDKAVLTLSKDAQVDAASVVPENGGKLKNNLKGK